MSSLLFFTTFLEKPKYMALRLPEECSKCYHQPIKMTRGLLFSCLLHIIFVSYLTHQDTTITTEVKTPRLEYYSDWSDDFTAETTYFLKRLLSSFTALTLQFMIS